MNLQSLFQDFNPRSVGKNQSIINGKFWHKVNVGNFSIGKLKFR